MICQSKGIDDPELEDEEEEARDTGNPGNLKLALQNFVSALSDVEKAFTGKLENEIIIDPIAVYREL